MAIFFVLCIFAIGFSAPMFVRSFSALGVSLLIYAILIGAILFWLASAGGGFMMLGLAFPILIFAAGGVAGHITSLVLLLASRNLSSPSGLIIAFAGFCCLPAVLAAISLYKNWQSKIIYAQLPQATTLPDIAACAPFRNAGPLLDAILVREGRDQRPGVLPSSELHIQYPSNYLEPFAPAFPIKAIKAPSLNFEMYVDDAMPAPAEDKRDANGKFIPFPQRRPSVKFQFWADLVAPRASARSLNFTAGRITGRDTVPDLELSPSPIPGLERVITPGPRTGDDTESYVAIENGEIAELVQCAGRDRFPNPQCSFRFDAGPVPVRGRFPIASLPDWGKIHQNIDNFAKCSAAAGQRMDETVPAAQ